MNKLSEIQAKIKAPKGQFNSFGKYRYRSAEDIVEAVKPVINPMGFALVLSDEVLEIGGRVYVKACAKISNGAESYEATGWAREEESKKGMDGSQITGAASSYARKYALNGLFAIDDTKDSDATNTHDEPADYVTDEQREELLRLLESSTYDERQREDAKQRIAVYDKQEQYEKAKTNLLQNQAGIDGAVNPGQREINAKIRRTAKAPVA
jgi:hypothetical protein